MVSFKGIFLELQEKSGIIAGAAIASMGWTFYRRRYFDANIMIRKAIEGAAFAGAGIVVGGVMKGTGLLLFK